MEKVKKKYFNGPKETIANEIDLGKLARDIKDWGQEFGFQQTGISNTKLNDAEKHLNDWIKAGYQGSMAYMSRHGSKRTRPGELMPGTVSIISVRMNYLPELSSECERKLSLADTAY